MSKLFRLQEKSTVDENVQRQSVKWRHKERTRPAEVQDRVQATAGRWHRALPTTTMTMPVALRVVAVAVAADAGVAHGVDVTAEQIEDDGEPGRARQVDGSNLIPVTDVGCDLAWENQNSLRFAGVGLTRVD